MTKDMHPAEPAKVQQFNELSLVHRVYYACKDGFAKLLLATLKDIEDANDRKAIVDQVSHRVGYSIRDETHFSRFGVRSEST